MISTTGVLALVVLPVAANIAPARANAILDQLAARGSLKSESDSDQGGLDTTITHQVYMDIGISETAWKSDRTLGDKTLVPISSPAGRIIIGLYGNLAPVTVQNFLRVVERGGLDGTIFSRIVAGEYVQAGKQGQSRMGEVETQTDLVSNSDIYSADAFKLPHRRPGTVSLSVSDNDEEPRLKLKKNFHSIEFLITTGPGPVPRLDGENIVFGRVLDGMNTVSTLTSVPTFKPNDNNRALNQFAELIGDDRAQVVRRKYGRPLRAVVITEAKLLGPNEGWTEGLPRVEDTQAADEAVTGEEEPTLAEKNPTLLSLLSKGRLGQPTAEDELMTGLQ
ncbi:MAG: hypothetical protein WDW36_002213 [Sanguina aurantia]